MKILFITHSLGHDYGAGVFARNIIEGVRQRGYTVTVATKMSVAKFPYEKSFMSFGLFRFFHTVFRLRNLSREADIVHTFDTYPYAIAAFLATLGLKKRKVLTFVGTGSILPLHKWYGSIVGFILKSFDRTTAISCFVRDEVLKKAPTLDISVITPGIDAKEIEKVKEKVPAVISKKLPYVLSVGSLRWRKGFGVSIRAFVRVVEKFPNLNYVIVGKKYTQKYFNKLQSLVEELGIKNSVHFVTDVDDRAVLYLWYKNASLFWLISQNKGYDVEGFGMVFLEAALSGLPVVGSLDCGVSDAMAEGRNGFLVKETDEQGAANAAIKILGDEKLRGEMSAFSREFAAGFDWQKKIDEYVLLYNSSI
ncbi:MAG: glycosyltransferase family 4 protein [bacterium]|nr:glycosyltransferase family 4 protein [bacterium]